MAVYVDNLFRWPIEITAAAAQARARRTDGQWCHLTADSLEELQAFAGRLGLKRAWFHARPRLSHYDLTPGMRGKALELGAIEGRAKLPGLEFNRRRCLRRSPPGLRFDHAEAVRAQQDWGCNCGPTAAAAILGMSLDELRPHLGDFEAKRYTNPTLMFQILRNLRVEWKRGRDSFAEFGLVRIQWEGPWTGPGVPIAARYRKTHWIGSVRLEDFEPDQYVIFDCNALSVGGWVPCTEWENELVPWLLKQCVPGANGRWHSTHVLELFPPAAAGEQPREEETSCPTC